MKKLSVLTAVILLITFTSCRDDDGAAPQTLIEEVDLSSDASMDANFEEVDVIVEAGMQTLDIAGRNVRDAILDCADISLDTASSTLTVDFGEGCEGPRGRVRSGKIIITYNGPRFEPGATRTTTFDNFYVDGVRVEGTRTLQNISESASSAPVFSISLTGGKLTFPDSTFSTREANRTRVWVRAESPNEDQAKVVESANGINRNGTSYSTTTLDTLVFKRGCMASRVFIPVAGVKEMTVGENVAIIDFGDGDCDNEVSVSINGDEPIIRTLRPRGSR